MSDKPTADPAKLERERELVKCERGIVGSAILDPSTIDRHECEIASYAFMDNVCGQLWPVLCSMRSRGLPVGDMALIVSETKGKATHSELAKIISSAIPAHENYYAVKLATEAEYQHLGKIMRSAREAYKSRKPPEEIRDQLIADLGRLAPSKAKRSVSDTMREVLERSVNRKTVPSVDTGLPILDGTLGGMRAGQMIVLAARPAVGKSALAGQIAVDAAKDGKRVLFISLEMPSCDVVSRILAFEAGLDFRRIVTGALRENEVQLGLRIADSYKSFPIEIEDRRNLNIDRLVSLVRSRSAAQKIDLLVVDYLGLIQGDKRKPRWEAVSEISHALKSVALAESLPVLALAQLNRESEGEVPMLSHLRDSGAIEQDADAVLLLHRDRGSQDCAIIVAKNRNGQTGRVPLAFHQETLRFSEQIGGAF